MTKSEVQKNLNTYGSITEAAKALDIPRTTFRDWVHRFKITQPTVQKKAAPTLAELPAELISLKQENNKLRRDALDYVSEHGSLLGVVSDIIANIPKVAPVASKFVVSKTAADKSVVDACLQLSDLHYGAVQPADEVEDFGEFSPAICEARMFNLFQDFLKFVTIQRGGYNIRNLHVLCTGDYISGDIQDLRVTNAFPSPVQTVKCATMLSSLIAGAASHFENVYVHIVTDDNHGRLTKKPQAKEGGTNNYAYIVGAWIKTSLSNIKNVSVNVIPRPWESVDCNGRRYLLTHGHHVTGWMGFPYFGIERMASREAMKRMNAPDYRKFHKIVMGHWHAPLKHPMYFIGGSASGTDAYDHGQGRSCKPQQTSWLIHEEHGEFAWTEWELHV